MLNSSPATPLTVEPVAKEAAEPAAPVPAVPVPVPTPAPVATQPAVAAEEPAAEAPVDESETQAPADDMPIVLAVDDSPTVRKLVSMTLGSRGYRVETAENGLDALRVLAQLTPVLILLDVNMPRMDGYKLCKMIKGHAKTQSIPVVMLSGKDGVFDKLRGKFAGCDDYISKPFKSAELLALVAEYARMSNIARYMEVVESAK